MCMVGLSEEDTGSKRNASSRRRSGSGRSRPSVADRCAISAGRNVELSTTLDQMLSEESDDQ